MHTSNDPGKRLATELIELSRHSAASQLSVKKLRLVIEQDQASLNIDGLIEQLIAADHYDGAQALAIAAGLSGLNVDARCLTSILPLQNYAAYEYRNGARSVFGSEFGFIAA